MTKQNRREKEKRLVGWMIQYFCRRRHHSKGELCTACRDLFIYAEQRVTNCPFSVNKTFCSNCKVHCYKPEMREKIRQVMRFSGPRMLLYHPVWAVKHLAQSKKERAGQTSAEQNGGN